MQRTAIRSELGQVGLMGSKAGDFEEGEISDSSSVEEISEEEFSKREIRVLKEPKLQSPMLWTMGGGKYVSGLFKLAWAQSVQNKPPSSVYSRSNKGETEVVIIDEKEEGDLGQGEIDSDSSESLGMNVDGSGLERVNSIVEFVKILTVTRKSFLLLCSTKLYNALESLLEIVGENGVVLKDHQMQLLFTAVQSTASVFCSMNRKSRKQNRRVLIRFLSLVNRCVPQLFSPENVKEIEGMVCSKIGISGLRSRALHNPLLDLHKDRKANSLPSPMRDLAPSTLIHRVLAPKMPVHTEDSKMHIYETEALKAVLNYQQKFSQSLFAMDRLPSPTPSEESGSKKVDISGEVSSFPVTGKLKSVNPPVLGPTMASTDGVSKSSKSRDPRLRLMDSEPNVVVNKTPEVEPLAGKMRMKKRKSVDDHTKDGPSMKRRRNPSENSGVVKTGTESDVVRPATVHINMKPQDPSRVLFGQNVEKAVPSQSLVSHDISLPSAKNPTSNPDVSVSQNVSSRAAHVIYSVTSRPSPIVSQKVPSQPKWTLSLNSDQHLWGDFEHLFDGYNDQQKAAILRERARRIDEQNKMFAAKKLCLVLDLDHTLLNSAKFGDVDPVHEKILRIKEEQDRKKPQRHLFCLPYMGMWTKLRPGIWTFLEKAAKLFELHLYTMGNKKYAREMAKLLDPTGKLFKGRVISRGDGGDSFDGDQRVAKSKDLEGVLGMESGVVIIDDSVRVWPHNRFNLITIERYIYFPCSRREFGLSGHSLLEIDHDERPEEGTLACSLSVIERIHQRFFAHTSLNEADVRDILASEKRKILSGCCILFSRVFPIGEANPHQHPLWQTAEQFGAVCTNQMDHKVTHVVANSLGTDKVNWALSNRKFVVSPGWVEASALLYRRANEQYFPLNP